MKMLGLVNYSDSDSDGSEEFPIKQNNQETQGSARKMKTSSDSDEETPCKLQKLPLPKLFGNTLAVKYVRDKSEKHEGRKRTFDHFDGNWPTYIYIPVKESPNFKIVYDRIIKSLNRYSNTVHTFPINMCHISISRTVPIRHYWITPIFDKLKDLLLGKEKFYYTLSSIQVYTNDEKTRTFVGFDVSTGHNTFLSLVEKTDQIFKEFDLEKYYESPSFHASIAWFLGNKKEEIESYLRDSGQSIMTGFSGGLSHLLAEKICMKTGNKIYQIALD